jgi:leader peptidase (prepilin peptidase) / N-methyltransferase
VVSSVLTILLTFALGASVGSFLNVVVYRLPAGRSLLYPPSCCPVCGTRLRPYDNVPVLGWLWLRGRCRTCKQPIARRYLWVELTTAILFVLVFGAFSFSATTVGNWVFFSWLIALALIDLDTLTLPNSLTQSGLIAGLLFQAIAGWSQSATLAGTVAQLWVGIVGAVIGIWLFDTIAIAGSIAFGQTAMGGGDAKLAAMMGAWLGWQQLLLAGFLACLLGVGIVGGAVALRRLDRRQPIPFGPFLAMGGMGAIFLGRAIVSAYMQLLMGPAYL